jgi:hypothetical protein
MCPRTGPDLPDGGIVRELMARQVDRRKALLIEALYAVDTDEVLLMMNFPDKEPLEVLISPDNAKRLVASLTRMLGERE